VRKAHGTQSARHPAVSHPTQGNEEIAMKKTPANVLVVAALMCASFAAQAHGDACPKPFQATGTIALPAG
jgi:hypothetical protein